MKHFVWGLFVFLALASFVAADTCSFDDSKLTSLEGSAVTDLPGARALLGGDGTFQLVLTDTEQSYSFAVVDGTFATTNATEFEYVITTDSCTAEAVRTNELPIGKAIAHGQVKLEATGFTAKVKSSAIKIVFKFASWFS